MGEISQKLETGAGRPNKIIPKDGKNYKYDILKQAGISKSEAQRCEKLAPARRGWGIIRGMTADRIRAELDLARELDEKARQHRQRAGELLRHAGGMVEVHAAARAAGLDVRMESLLLNMAPPTPGGR